MLSSHGHDCDVLTTGRHRENPLLVPGQAFAAREEGPLALVMPLKMYPLLTMANAALIPDRLRNHFPLNGGRRPTDRERHEARDGIEAARTVLDEAVPPPSTAPHVVVPLTPEQIRRAHTGIEAARDALGEGAPEDRIAPE